MRVIVTGASGFIGKNLILRLPRDWEVAGVYCRSTDFEGFLEERRLRNICPVRCDLTSSEEVGRVTRNLGESFDACVYLAANGDPALSAEEVALDLKLNTLALTNLLSCLRIKRFVFFSSGAVYDGMIGLVSPELTVQPKLPYGISKLAAEQYIKFFSSNGRLGEYVILRFFGAYGPYEPERKIYSRMVKRFVFEGGNEFTVRGDGENLIDAMYVTDTVQGILKVIEGKEKNVTVDLCSGTPLTINELVRKSARFLGRKDVKLHHEGTVPEYIRFYVSGAKMRELFGFEPKICLEDGLGRLGEFLRTRETVKGRP